MTAVEHPALIAISLALAAAVYLRARKTMKRRPSISFPTLAQAGRMGATPRLRTRGLPLVLRVAAIVLTGLALSRPRQGIEETRVTTEGIDIMLAIDASTSMLAEDFKDAGGKRVNRLETVKDVVSGFVARRPDDRIGAVVFAGRPYTLCPLTLDKGVLAQFIGRADTGLVEDGTAVGSAIVTAAKRLGTGSAKTRIIIMLTDGRNNAGNVDPAAAAELAAKLGIRIYTIGAGTKGPVPYPGTDMFGRKGYQMVEIDLDEESLRNIAAKTGGRYFHASDRKGLEDIYARIDKLEKTKTEQDIFTDFSERYRIFLIPALIALLVEIALGLTVYRTAP